MKLEIGAGERPTPGYVHNDIRDLNDIEIVCDALEIHKHTDDKFLEVRANHILEHFPYNGTVDVLRNWSNLLLPGGKIHLEVPNFSWQTRAHSSGEITDEKAVYYVYGEQNYEGNYHKAAFTDGILRQCLQDADFKHITIVDIGQVLVADATKASLATSVHTGEN